MRTPHVELTREEREEVAAFYGEYFRSGGTGAKPSAFQLDALNDALLRDQIIFWQISGDPSGWNPRIAEKAQAHDLSEAFGASPTADQAMKTLIALVDDIGDPEVDAVDTAVVVTLMHAMWLILGGDFWSLAAEMEKVVEIYALLQKDEEEDLPHVTPLTGVGQASALLLAMERSGVPMDELYELSAQMVGIEESHPNAAYAREFGALTRAKSKAELSVKSAVQELVTNWRNTDDDDAA